MRFAVLLSLLALLSADSFAQASEVFAQASYTKAPAALDRPAEAPHYLTSRGVMLFRDADSTRPIRHLNFRESVMALGPRENGWTRIRTEGGTEGYVFGEVLSNIWIRVSKSRGLLYLYRGEELVRTYQADFGYNPLSDKQQRGSNLQRDHWRTPEGTFYVVRRNPGSTFYKAFVLNYPNSEHAARGLERGLISQREHDAIVDAELNFQTPPMNTALGGMIEIHGHGTGAGLNWTQGCVAVTNRQMDELWRYVAVGTPVVVEP